MVIEQLLIVDVEENGGCLGGIPWRTLQALRRSVKCSFGPYHSI